MADDTSALTGDAARLGGVFAIVRDGVAVWLRDEREKDIMPCAVAPPRGRPRPRRCSYGVHPLNYPPRPNAGERFHCRTRVR